ncbi:hypothetical protein NMY22_g2654 [Coprinellus aureogranulatus]|nr:hypothetical protein NMY22_g2654 [Coprinellus aureogranulatus]
MSSRDVVRASASRQPDTYAILILGVSKCGKSTFVNWITGPPERATVLKLLKSATREVQEIELPLALTNPPPPKIIVVDTPGLDHTDMNVLDVVGEITRWLQRLSTTRRIRVGAVIYLQDISVDAISPAMRLDIDILESLCGDAAISRNMVTVATTKWGRRPEIESSNDAEFRTELWAKLLKGNVAVEPIRDAEAARTLLNEVVTRMTGTRELPVLKIQSEFASGLQLENTGVGRCLGNVLPRKAKSPNPLSALEHREKRDAIVESTKGWRGSRVTAAVVAEPQRGIRVGRTLARSTETSLRL